ncbi:MAG: hypothetical protein ACREXO_08315 [Advenella sp.]
MISSPDIFVQILYKWDEASKQTANLRPVNSTAALLTWTVLPLPTDECVPEPIMRAVTETATTSGTLAFRLLFNVDLPDGLTVHPAPRAWFGRRVVEGLLRCWPANIATAITPHAAIEMFFQNWHLQDQAALVQRNDTLSHQSMDHLRRARDWRRHDFPADARVLIAPAVDGEGVLFVAADVHELEGVLLAVTDRLRVAGLEVTIEHRSE